MMRECFLIEAENGVGLYFSKNLARSSLEYLNKKDRNMYVFKTYEEAKGYIFERYDGDMEVDLTKFKVNHILFRDKTERYNFFVQSSNLLGYGTDIGTRVMFENFLDVSSQDIVEVASTEEAEQGARYGFVNEYGESSFYYAGILLPGNAISFGEMLKYNCIDEKYVENMLKRSGFWQ